MALIRGGPAGPDGSGGAYDNTVQTDRAAWWHAMGGRQGVIKGFAHAGVAGQMALDFTPGAALVGERDGTGAASIDRGYLVHASETTRVLFGTASASDRNDAVVAAFVDVEAGPVGTGQLEVGPHLTVVPGVSGTTTPRTDAQINDYLGRGGWVRLMDVPIAAGSTEIAVSGISLSKEKGGWFAVPTSSSFPPVTGAEFQIRRVGRQVFLHGAVTRQNSALTPGAAETLMSSVNLDPAYRPVRTMRAVVTTYDSTGAVLWLSILTNGSLSVRNQGTQNVAIGARLDFNCSWLVD